MGVSFEDLLYIYVLFIRNVTEFCAVAFYSSLTQAGGYSEDMSKGDIGGNVCPLPGSSGEVRPPGKKGV